MTPQAPRDFSVDDFHFGMMRLKVERLQALPLNASGTASTGSEVHLGEDRKADPGHAAALENLGVLPEELEGRQLARVCSGFPRDRDV